jgi:hypothetical protein
MKKVKVLSLVILGSALLVSASRVSARGPASLFVPVSELRFAAVPGFSGIELAPAEGDPAKGPSHFFLRFAPGFKAPLHHHTANHSGTVVAGTLVLTVAGQEKRLPAGSFFALNDKASHTTSCEAGAACVLSMDVRGKWDVVPEKEKQAEK